MSKKNYVANAADYPNPLIQKYHVDNFVTKLNNLSIFHHLLQFFLQFIGLNEDS